MSNVQAAVWQGHSRQWSLVGAPLKPSPEDGAMMLDLLGPGLKQDGAGPQVAILGVTPEIVQLNWPAGTTLSAFDQSQAMIDSVWQPHPRIASTATCATWQKLPAKDEEFHAVVGDGSFNVLAFGDYGDVLAELTRTTRPGAALVVRCFVRPDAPESLTTIKRDLADGAFGSFHAFKWRLAMLLADRGQGTVAVQEVYRVFEREFDRRALSETTCWPRAVIETINAYRDTPTVYTFPTLAQLKSIVGPTWKFQAARIANYELAERCPTLLFRRLDGADAVAGSAR